MIDKTRTLRTGFLHCCQQYPQRPALEVDGRTLTYQELRDQAASIAATLSQHAPSSSPPLTAVLAERSQTAFTGILGTLLRGHGYVPLNPSFPLARTQTMLDRSQCQALIVDEGGAEHLETLLGAAGQPMVVLLPFAEDTTELARRCPGHTLLGRHDLLPAEGWRPEDVDVDQIAYLLFTSGSTGAPKGVMVAHRNVVHFLDVMSQRYQIQPEDRLTQIFELVFDLSVFDLFMAWEAGACVCCPTKADLLMPDQFLEAAKPTVWFSVPSTALLMKKLGKLQPKAFPSLRVSLFCGEALTAEVTSAWAQAAPNSIVENLYGPTELTLACTLYRWDEALSPPLCENGVVPIGDPYPGMSVYVADESLNEVAPGEVGELLMAGPQVTLGYWRDEEKTAAAFVIPPGQTEIHYRTGDRVRRPAGDGPLLYLGRADHQVQVHGYRVELGEVEAALREAAGVNMAAALGWPVQDGAADRIVAFIQAEQADLKQLLTRLRQRLPNYMVPRELRLLAEFPLNANGKIDRRALAGLLQEATAAAGSR